VVLVDSSFWIDVDHGAVHFDDYVPDDETVVVCPVVVMEVLRGAHHRTRYQIARDLLMNVELLDSPTPLERFEAAAKLYIACRAIGVTPSTADCLVAACAIRHDVPLLHLDHDFDHIARVAPLRIFTRS
jgi:predicted nucleic acid-binding protein